jgi:hypothetical protein
MTLTCHINDTDKYDKIENDNKNFYLVFLDSRGDSYTDALYTNNPIGEIHERKPKEITWYPDTDSSGELVALYINTLLNEDYELDYKRALDKEDNMIGASLYFKKVRNGKGK